MAIDISSYIKMETVPSSFEDLSYAMEKFGIVFNPSEFQAGLCSLIVTGAEVDTTRLREGFFSEETVKEENIQDAVDFILAEYQTLKACFEQGGFDFAPAVPELSDSDFTVGDILAELSNFTHAFLSTFESILSARDLDDSFEGPVQEALDSLAEIANAQYEKNDTPEARQQLVTIYEHVKISIILLHDFLEELRNHEEAEVSFSPAAVTLH